MQIDLFEQDGVGILIAGVDEAGRGPLCGDVYAAAVILDKNHGIDGLTDSKKISEKKRYLIAEEIKKKAIAQYLCETIVKGDLLHEEISAASILAKTARDISMIEADQKNPEYGFAKHKGYGTKQHMEAIAQYGVLDCHRRSFAPIQKALAMHKA